MTSGSGQLKTSVCEYVYSVVSDSIRPNELSLPSSSVMECSRQEYWDGLPCSPEGDLPHSGTADSEIARISQASASGETETEMEICGLQGGAG